MYLLEHDAKTLLAAAGISVPAGVMATLAARPALPEPGPWVVKAQVTTGGRGKAGGVKFAADVAAVEATAQSILDLTIKGRRVEAVRIECQVPDAQEAYLSFTLDPASGAIRVLFAPQGGVEVEDDDTELRHALAAPEAGEMAQAVADLAADQPDARRNAIADAGDKLARAFLAYEARLVEINPLFVRMDGTWVAGDAKMVVDENAIYRQPAISALLDERGDAYTEARTKRDNGFDYVQVDPMGEIGMLTTGAGLSMMLIDELTNAGLRPFNFLDLRSGDLRGKTDRIVQVLNWMAAAPNVRIVLVNIFAGVTHLGEFTGLLLQSLVEVPQLNVPIVARLVGNGMDDAAAMIRASGRDITLEPDLDKAIALVAAQLKAAP